MNGSGFLYLGGGCGQNVELCCLSLYPLPQGERGRTEAAERGPSPLIAEESHVKFYLLAIAPSPLAGEGWGEGVSSE